MWYEKNLNSYVTPIISLLDSAGLESSIYWNMKNLP